MDKLQIQPQVDQGQQALLDTIPHVVDSDPRGTDLEPRGHPDDEDGDVDDADQARHDPLQFPHASPVVHDQGNTVDDDLHKTLYLYSTQVVGGPTG